MTPNQAMDHPLAWLHLMSEVAQEEEALDTLNSLDTTASAVGAVMSKDGARGYKDRRTMLRKAARI